MLPSFLQLAVNIAKQGKRFVAHSPALDISTSGKTEKEARDRFAELAETFFEELSEAGTTEDVLLELGWKKGARFFTPPTIKQRSLKVRVPTYA